MRIVKELLFDSSTKHGRRFDLFIQFLIIVSIINFSIQTIPNLSKNQKWILNGIELFSVIIFSLEYIFRVIFSSNRIKFIFSFFGLIDLIAVLPFYLSIGIDLRSVRAFRLFRLFRLFKLLKYNNAISNLRKAFVDVKSELIIFSVATVFLLYFSAVGIYYFENKVQPEVFSSIFHSMWWSVATLTTVGYGDIYPITIGGKMFSSLVVFLGLGLVAVPTGLIASSFSKAFKDDSNK